MTFGTRFLRALHAVDPDMAVDIEHEDQELDVSATTDSRGGARVRAAG